MNFFNLTTIHYTFDWRKKNLNILFLAIERRNLLKCKKFEIYSCCFLRGFCSFKILIFNFLFLKFENRHRTNRKRKQLHKQKETSIFDSRIRGHTQNIINSGCSRSDKKIHTQYIRAKCQIHMKVRSLGQINNI